MDMTVAHIEMKRYLETHSMNGSGLAQQAGLSSMQVAHLLKGRRRASLEVAVALELATRGAVTPRAWTQPAESRSF